ncbi:MAG: hypothetical protein JWO69_1403, partial [Thermoleophilia bacterium]|nr:hypothetical protein [Thermoleophilia bacterium]
EVRLVRDARHELRDAEVAARVAAREQARWSA